MKWIRFTEKEPQDKQKIWIFFIGRWETSWETALCSSGFDHEIRIGIFRIGPSFESKKEVYKQLKWINNLEENHAYYYGDTDFGTADVIAWMPFDDMIIPEITIEEKKEWGGY